MTLVDPLDPTDRPDRADPAVATTPDVCVVVADSSDDWVGGSESRDSDRPSGRDLPSGRCRTPGYRRPAACQNSFDPAPAHHERPENRFGLPDRLLLDLLDPAKPACHWVCYRPLFQISLCLRIDGLRAVLEPAIPRAARFLERTVSACDGRNHPGRRPRLERPERGRMNQRSTFQAPDRVGINVLCFSLQSKGTM